MSNFSDRFRQLKEEKQGMTLKELSAQLDISVPNLSYYMKGREPNYDTLIKIADYFDVTVDWLIGRSDQRNSTHQSLENEIISRFSKYNEHNIHAGTKIELTIFKKSYLELQEKIVDFLYFYYSLLLLLDQLATLKPELDYTKINNAITTDLVEIMEYQIDLVDSAQKLFIDSTSGAFFEYYFNSLTRIDLLINRCKLLVIDMIEIALTNFDGNNDKITVMADFVKNAENYGKGRISDIQLSNLFNSFKLE